MLSIEQTLIFLACLHKRQINLISHPLPAEKVTDTLNQSLAYDNMPHLDSTPTYSVLYTMGFGKPTLFFGFGLNFALQTGPKVPIPDGTLRRVDSRRSSSTGRDHSSATRVFSRALMHRRRSPERLIYYARCPWQVSTSHWTTETALESEPYARKHSCSAQMDQSNPRDHWKSSPVLQPYPTIILNHAQPPTDELFPSTGWETLRWEKRPFPLLQTSIELRAL